MQLRNLLYSKNILSITKLNCAVVSVGNISMGGTGKTPFVIALASGLQSKYKVAVLSRGYGRKTKGLQLVSDGVTAIDDWTTVGDEPFLIANALPNIPVVVDEDRVRGGQYIVDNFKPDVIILDDAFQHRRLHRDLDIVLIDSSKNRQSQFMRESVLSLKRADFLFLTKAIDNKRSSAWIELVSKFDKPVIELKQRIGDKLIGTNNKEINVSTVKNKSVNIFSGIGNPASFRNQVEGLNCIILDEIIFRDHHQYTASDAKYVNKKFDQLKPDFILTTEKDIVKFPPTDLPLLSIQINTIIPQELLDKIKIIVK